MSGSKRDYTSYYAEYKAKYNNYAHYMTLGSLEKVHIRDIEVIEDLFVCTDEKDIILKACSQAYEDITKFHLYAPVN